jgi:dihydropteroate synthase
LTQQLPIEDRLSMSADAANDHIAVMMGGRLAEEIIFGQLTTGASNDIQQATDMARRMVCEWGMSEKLGPLHFGKREAEVFLGRDFNDGGKEYSEQTAIEIDAEVRRIVTENYERARQVVVDNLDKLKVLADALLEYETVDGAEIDILFAGGHLDRKPSTWASAGAKVPPEKRPAPGGASVAAQHLRAAAADPRSREGLKLGRCALAGLKAPCLIVGVLNCTPDSFSDGGRFGTAADAIEAGLAMVDEGADWIDVGGESTRPGSMPVDPDEELRRVVPVLAGLGARLGGRARLSIDTYKASTARAALHAGATVVNDVSGGLLDPEILGVAASGGAAIVLGHLRGPPAATMMDAVAFDDVVAEVVVELGLRVAAARAAGCVEIWADPGIGFGKRLEHNLALLRNLPTILGGLGVPLMVGVSRKAFLGQLTGKPPTDRIFGTAAAVTAAVLGGAAAVRVHDVAAMRDAVRRSRMR